MSEPSEIPDSLPTTPIIQSTRSQPALPKDWDYEATVAQIEAIIARIEMGELGLAEVFDQFAEAVKHLQECEEFLSHHREKVDLLIETLTDGDGY